MRTEVFIVKSFDKRILLSGGVSSDSGLAGYTSEIQYD